MNKEQQFYVIYQIRKQFPVTPIYYYLNLIVKSIGLYICTHNVRNLEKANITVAKILSNLIVFKGDSPQIIVYEKISLGLFICLVVLLVAFLVVFKLIMLQQEKGHLNKLLNTQLHNFNYNTKTSTRVLKTTLKALSYILLVLIFIIQHLIEILLLSIVVSCLPSSQLDVDKVSSLKLINYSTLIIINLISLVILCIYYYLFLILSFRPIEIVQMSYKPYMAGYSFYLSLLCILMQGLHSISHLFSLSTHTMHITVTIISVTLLLIDLWSNYNEFNMNKSFYSKAVYYIKWDCLYSGIMEIVLNYSITEGNCLSQKMSLYKLIFEIVLVIATAQIIQQCYTLKRVKSLSTNMFFQTDIKTTLEELKLFSNMITDYFSYENDSSFKALLNICQEHISNCSNSKCLCRRISSYTQGLASKSYHSKLEKLIKELILIGEQEVNNLIVHSIQSKANRDLTQMVYFHINYIDMIKHDKLLTFYLMHNYYNNQLLNRNSTYIDQYYLYEAKRYLYHTFVNKQKSIQRQPLFQRLNIPLVNSFKSFQTIVPVYKYLLAIDAIFNYLLSCCQNFDVIILYISTALLGKNPSATSNDLLELLTINKKLNRKLKHTFIEGISKKGYKSLAIDYLLSHYFILMYGKVPLEYSELFELQLSFDTIEKESLFFDTFPQENNSVIATFNSEDSFTLTYVSHVFCKVFRWNHDKIVNHNFNRLLPDLFGKDHDVYLKLFALNNNYSFIKTSFLLNEASILIPVSIQVKKILLLKNGFNLIFIFSKRKTCSKSEMSYNLLLGRDLNILSVSHTFEKHFYFTKEMFAKLKINFSDFMGLNTQRLKGNFDMMMTTLSKPIKLDEINKAISIFNTISNNKVFSYRGFEFIQSLLNLNQNKTYDIKVPKREVCKSSAKILQCARNFNLENSIIERIEALKDRITQTLSRKEINEFYSITFDLKRLGKLIYFIVFLQENITKEQLMELSTYFSSFIFDRKNVEEMQSVILNTDPKMALNHFKNKYAFNHYDVLPVSRDKISSLLSSMRVFDSAHVITDNGASNTNIRFLNSSHFNKSSSISNFNTTHNKLQVTTKNDAVKILRKSINTNKTNETCIKFMESNIAKVIIYTITLVILIIILGNTIDFLLAFQLSTKIFRINYESFILKSDISFCSLLFVRNCLVKDGINSIDALDFTWKFQLRGQSMLNNLNSLQLYINELHSFESISPIYELLYTTSEYNVLKDDWNESIRHSTIFDELNSIYYFFSTVYYSNEFRSCNIKHYNTEQFNDATRVPFTEEKFLYYIISNSMSSLMNQMNLLSNHTLVVFNEFQYRTQTNYCFVYAFAMILNIILFALLVTKVICSNALIKKQFIALYNNNEETNGISNNDNSDYFRTKLTLFRNMVKALNKHTTQAYELRMKNSTCLSFNIKAKKLALNLSSSLNQSTERGKKRATQEQAQLIRMSFENLKHYSRMVQLPVVIRVISALIILFLLNFCLQLGILFYINIRFGGLQIQNNIGINIIERIPIFAQLLLYYICSIIQNDVYYITKTESDFTSKSLNYYNISIDFKRDSVYLQLTKSNYAFLYFSLQLAQLTTENYFTDNRKHHKLPETLDWYIKFNSKSEFPIHTAVGFVKYYQTCHTVIHCLELVNRYSANNLYVANQMAVNSMDTIFDLMTQELNYLYLNFNNENNANGNRDKIAYLSTENFWIIFENSQRAIKAASDTFNVSILNDILHTYKDTANIVLILFFLIILFNFFCMYVCVFLIYSVIEKKLLILKTTGARIIKAKGINSN